ncbi:MAG: gliding motility-associated C-terminal domain-containing protein, partial [Flavobacteriales bacterium]|nr:gliding motility-associated C-terminal domain-containing protein [Flavobacteriales bacterium]
IVLDATGPGLIYAWSTGVNTPTITVASAGTYSVTVTNAATCTASDAITIAYASPVPVDLGADLVICQGGAAILNATTPGASYLWNTGAVTATIAATTSGPYSVVVTQGSCTVADAVNVTVNPMPAVDLGADVTLCAGEDVVLDATWPGATYLWNTGAITPTLTATTTGNYSVTVSLNGCVANDAINVNVLTATSLDLGPDVTLCTGEQVVLDATTAGATYLWSTGAVTPTITVTTSGNYSVEVFSGMCSVTDAIDVTVNPMPAVDLGADVTLCAGEDVVLDATWPGATYLWNTGAITPTWTATTTGNYSVAVSLNGCVANDALNVNVLTATSLDLGPDVTLCTGEQVVLDATTAGATYLWSNGAVTPTITVTASGNYSVEVFSGMCSVTDAIDVTVNPMPVVDLGADVTLCSGEDVVLDATWPGATYLWNTGAITPTLTATTTGNYSVTVSLNGCVANDAINVNVLTATSLDLGPDVTLCTGEQVVLDATTAGATYLWSTGAVTPTITVTTSGNYSVEVFSGMCSVTDAIDVTVNPMPAVDLGADVTLCAGEDVVLDATWPGATYLWNTGAITPTWTATTTGNYSVAVSLNGCVANDAINVNVLTATSLDLGPDVTLCTGEQVVLDATTVGATYLWSNGAVTPTITVTTSGNYSVEVFSGNCSVTDAVDVTFDPIPLIDLGPDMILCGGETAISLDVTWPDAIYDWNTGSSSPTIEVTASGSYSVNVDLNGCVVSEVVSVTFGSLDFYLGADTLLCPGEVLELSVDPANGVATWNDVIEASSYEVSAPGLYWVSIAGTVGCNAADTIVVVYADPGSVELGPDLVLCAGGSLELDASIPGGTYQWEDGSTDPVRTILASGNYAVDVTVGQCVVSDAIEVTFNPLPIVELGPDVALCPGTMAVFDATTVDATYLWQDGSTAAQYVTNVAEIISVTVTVDGCSSTDQAVVTALIGPSIELGADTTLCEGASLLLDLSNSGSTLLWEDGSTAATRSITTAGVFWVDATLNTCVLRDSITVSIFSPDALDLGPDQLLCSGTTVVLDASFDGATYAWSTGATTPTLTVGQPGSYGVTVSFAGCVAQDQVDVDVLTLSVPDLGPDVTICEGSSTILSIQPNGASILWSTGATTTEITVTEAGSYTVTLDSLGCQISDAVNVVHTPLISEVDLGSDIALCTGAHVVLEAQPILGASYVWNTGTSGRFLYVDQPGAYTITAQGNCIDAVATIVVSPEDCGTYVYVPNSFTPNNDGINDRFLPSLAGPVDVYELNIFDRWGERIHTTADRYAGWDGTYNGVLSQDGVYVWTLDYRVLGPTGVKSERLVGHVTLLR